MNSEKIAIKSRDMEKLREYLDHLRSHPRLTFLFVELTRRCNLACLHCGSRCDGGQTQALDFDLLVKALETVAEDFDPKSVMICLTGGEPLLYPHFWPLVDKIRELRGSDGLESPRSPSVSTACRRPMSSSGERRAATGLRFGGCRRSTRRTCRYR